MRNMEDRPSEREQHIQEMLENELHTVTGGKYACIRAEWITIDDDGTILPIFYPC
jgi:hypothetical protein